MKQRQWNSENNRTITVDDLSGTASAYDLYVCQNEKQFEPSRYITINARGATYHGRILEVVDDVDLFHDRYPDPSMTFFEYMKSKNPDLTVAYFLRAFDLKPEDHLKTVFKLAPVSPSIEDETGKTFPVTAEQEAIIERFGDTKNLLIQAFAGTGKTSTLEMLTRAYPDRRFIYLVFNRSAADTAREKFPDNVNVKTIHAFAFEYMSKHMKIINPVGTYRIPVFADILGIDYDHAEVARHILDEFCYSDKMEFEGMDEDVLSDDMEAMWLVDKGIVNLDKAMRYAKEFYHRMENDRIPVTHNFYLKQFQRLGIADKTRYDAVLLDEAQDSNPITYDIINRINGQKVVIGDRHQKIYGFRNTVDISGKFLLSDPDELPLTQSFRFHEKIADLANNLLSGLKDEKMKIQGVASHRDIKTFAFVTRTNAKIIDLIDGMIDRQTWKTVRDPEELFKLPMSITKIFTNRKMNYAVPSDLLFLSQFKSLDDLEDYAKRMEDVELISALKVSVKKPNSIERCFQRAIEQYEKDADVYLTTAHTSKGLEWDEVYLTDDYPDILAKIKKAAESLTKFVDMQKTSESKQIQKIVEEINLLYVAMTRAREKVDLKDVKNSDTLFSGKMTDKTGQNAISPPDAHRGSK